MRNLESQLHDTKPTNLGRCSGAVLFPGVGQTQRSQTECPHWPDHTLGHSPQASVATPPT